MPAFLSYNDAFSGKAIPQQLSISLAEIPVHLPL